MAQQTEKAKAKLHSLTAALESGALAQVRRILNSGLAPVDIAHLIESSPPKARKLLWELVDKELEGEVMQNLSEELQSHFLSDMSAEEVVDLTADLDTDDVADMLQQLPERVTQEVLESMDHQDRARLEAVLGYPEDSAGGLMNTDTVTIRPDITLEVVLRYLRRHKSLPAMTDNLLVVNRQNEFIGTLAISKLLVSDPQQTVREVMSTDARVIQATQHESEVAKLFERHDLVSAPVVDAAGMLLGRITIDDVVDVIRETADHSLMSMAGLDDEEDTFAPTLKTSRRRAVWLGINLLTALAASAVIGLFDKTIEQVVALAVLMPIVASMGGIAGSQVLTLVIRGQALGHLSGSNFRWLFNREIMVAAINGVLWAVVIALITYAWFRDPAIALIIGAAIIINLMVAAMAGASLPLLLKARGIDPALAGSVVLTTVTDVIGFLSFLGLATLFYL
ncbi:MULTISPECIES: magnesium transporter [Oceanospirillaceae]|jgi:magnesium transporter|uniref:magnesium transporter n=1 Tax=Oceanospirillaceae TaxID=135620 RepID=UPI0011953DF3|nr:MULTISPECIES: magnesium transporter [Thalassolituus]MCA6060021.1 magnesium transporter [Thalassolituus sp. ST750PaO-4]MCB2388355.1 magnesium transporter [Thalassolituus alkanivorans]MCB2423927.1 magnesium transporter [Thalassolituus alkanivorans]TVV39488.1 magnesium transporter [Thalassolituus sp. C2-1]TVV39536.1 magnesium transporter [Thalassolituus sp. C2-1]